LKGMGPPSSSKTLKACDEGKERNQAKERHFQENA